MKLNIQERISLVELLQAKIPRSSYAGLSEVHRLLTLLAFKEKELEEFNVEILPSGELKWDNSKSKSYVVDIPMGEWIMKTIRGILVEMNHEEELSLGLLPLYEKIVIDYSVL